jgi:hypothetical protein
MIDLYKKIGVIFFVVTFFTLIVGFFFNEDVSGGGTSGDFYYTLSYVNKLKDNILTTSDTTVHLPLHYILLSKIDYFINNFTILRFIFLLISISIPILFYLCLRIKFVNLSSNNALIISSLIFIFPSFRYSAIWANAHITALIFFLLSTYFFLRIKNSSYLNINIFLNLLFLSLATYSRQYYALFFLFFLYFYFKNFKFINFLFIVLYVTFLSIPGLILVYNNPKFLLGDSGAPIFSLKLYNSLLVSSSIIFFYFVPLIFIMFLKKKFLYKKNLFFMATVLISISIVLVSSIFFDYNFKLGGGVFLKASRYFFSNNLLFYITSIIGFMIIFYIAKENKNNFIILTIILFGFSGTYILQKYFEPMIYVIIYLYFNTYLHKYFLNMKFVIISYLYYFFYYIAALINSLYKLSTSI